MFIPSQSFNIAPEKLPKPNRKVVFQPSFFRGYVKLPAGNLFIFDEEASKIHHFTNLSRTKKAVVFVSRSHQKYFPGNWEHIPVNKQACSPKVGSTFPFPNGLLLPSWLFFMGGDPY